MSDVWDYPTPSQAEGEREPDPDEHPDEHPDVARSTPSQAEGERGAEEEVQAEPGKEQGPG